MGVASSRVCDARPSRDFRQHESRPHSTRADPAETRPALGTSPTRRQARPRGSGRRVAPTTLEGQRRLVNYPGSAFRQAPFPTDSRPARYRGHAKRMNRCTGIQTPKTRRAYKPRTPFLHFRLVVGGSHSSFTCSGGTEALRTSGDEKREERHSGTAGVRSASRFGRRRS